eukprot:scaffold3_cov31-Tisochrysis_lutea.AAC.1
MPSVCCSTSHTSPSNSVLRPWQTHPSESERVRCAAIVYKACEPQVGAVGEQLTEQRCLSTPESARDE